MISIARKVLDAFHQPITVNQKQFTISLSLGIALAPIDGLTSSDLMRTADVALYRAKNHATEKFQFYSHCGKVDTPI